MLKDVDGKPEATVIGDKNRLSFIPVIFWIGLSLFVMFISNKLGLGRFRDPGPGLMPFLLGLILFLVSLSRLIISLLKMGGRDQTVKEEMGQSSFWKISLLVGCLFAYGLFFEKLGYLIATFLLLTILFRLTGNKRWSVILISSALVALATYFAFNFLGLKFPAGILNLR